MFLQLVVLVVSDLLDQLLLLAAIRLPFIHIVVGLLRLQIFQNLDVVPADLIEFSLILSFMPRQLLWQRYAARCCMLMGNEVLCISNDFT